MTSLSADRLEEFFPSIIPNVIVADINLLQIDIQLDHFAQHEASSDANVILAQIQVL